MNIRNESNYLYFNIINDIQMIRLLIDGLKYPLDKNKKNNKFHHFMNFLFKDYPAFLWDNPNPKKIFWRILLFPFLFVYNLFKKVNKK
jgi:hypothetical protein